MDAGYTSIIILAITIVFYIFELLPIPVVAVGSSALMVIFKVIPANTAWAGFSQDAVLLIAGMFVVCGALVSTGAADSMAKFIIKIAGGRPKLSILLMLAAAGAISFVVNNTTSTVMFLPLILGVIAQTRDQGTGVYEQKYMQTLTIMTQIGGMITLVGSAVGLIASGMLEASGFPPFTFLQFTKISVPMFVIALIYTFTIGDKYADMIFGKNPQPSEFVQNFITEYKQNEQMNSKETAADPKEAKEAARKKITSSCILLISVIALTASDFLGISLGTIGISCGLLCVITKCLSVKDMYQKIEWGTIFMIGGMVGCAAGLSSSGGGQIIADFFIGLFGSALTPMAVFTVLSVLSGILTQFMSNTGVVGMLIPIGVSIASGLGMNALPVAIGIYMCASLSFITPMASVTQVIIMNWGSYKFNDYIKYSGPLTVLLIAIVLILVPIFYPLV